MTYRHRICFGRDGSEETTPVRLVVPFYLLFQTLIISLLPIEVDLCRWFLPDFPNRTRSRRYCCCRDGCPEAADSAAGDGRLNFIVLMLSEQRIDSLSASVESSAETEFVRTTHIEQWLTLTDRRSARLSGEPCSCHTDADGLLGYL